MSEELRGSLQLGGFTDPVLLKLGLEKGGETLAHGDVRDGVMQAGAETSSEC